MDSRKGRPSQTVGMWGAGSSASAAVRILGIKPTRFFSSEGGGTFQGTIVEPGKNIDNTIDALFVCSIHYSEIVSQLRNIGYPLERVRVFHGHLIHPTYLLNEVTDFLSMDYIYSGQYLNVISSDLTPRAVEVANRLDHLTHAFRNSPTSGLVLEFGVFRGESFFHLQTLTDRMVYGFDSNRGFEGREWSGLKFHGHQPLPAALEQHNGFIEGWFEDTLPTFLDRNSETVAFVHYDAGELRATRFVLEKVFPRLREGSVLVFDELLATDDANRGSSPEWIAFHEAVSASGAKFEWIARSGYSASVRMTEV